MSTIEEIFALPDADEQDVLLAALARLVRQRGVEPLVGAPLLLPEPRFWPDPVVTRGHAVATLVRRLLMYAGLGELGVDIEIGAPRNAPVVDAEPTEAELMGAAGWFLGIEDGVCWFGVANASLGRTESLIGTLGHEVAHAYRTYHGLVVPTAAIEEKLTDLTTVYLGFGLFTLESSFQFETGHYSESGERLLFERRTLGYLLPGQLAFLLAVRLKLHPAGKRDLEAALEELAPNHAAALRGAFQALPARSELIQRLELPPEADWPPLLDLATWQPALPTASVHVRDRGQESRKRQKKLNISFRVPGDRRFHWLAYGIAPGILAATASEAWWLQVAFMFGVPVLAYWAGCSKRYQYCSGCQHVIDPKSRTCGWCDARLVGTIAHVNERIDAAERYWAGRRERQAGSR